MTTYDRSCSRETGEKKSDSGYVLKQNRGAQGRLNVDMRERIELKRALRLLTEAKTLLSRLS